MKKTRAILLLSALILATTGFYSQQEPVMEINFDLGKNIRETAKNSGAPHFATRNVAGLVSYGIRDIPLDIAIVYKRPAYAVRAQQVYALTMYADKDHNNNLAVEAVHLQFDTTALTSHAAVKSFIEDLVAQFQQGEWKRYIEDFCPATTGRSAFLNQAGLPEEIELCALDPAHRLSMDDWIHLGETHITYQWLGGEVLATITVYFMNGSRGLDYDLTLEFENLASKLATMNRNDAEDLAKGDANGWDSTKKHAQAVLKRAQLVKILEDNAIKRGDSVVARPLLP